MPLPSQPKLVLIYRPWRDGRLSWPWVAGWLHTEMSVRHRELVAHLSTNRARRRLTSLIEANVLTTTPDQQPLRGHWYTQQLADCSTLCGHKTQHYCNNHISQCQSPRISMSSNVVVVKQTKNFWYYGGMEPF